MRAKRKMLKIIQKLEGGQVLGRGWRTELKVPASKRDCERLSSELVDNSFMAQRGMWHVMEQRM